MTGCASQRKPHALVKIDHSSVEEPLQALVSWIASQLQSSASSSLSLVIPSLMSLMSCPEARMLFHNTGGIGYLSRHLRIRQNGSATTKRSKAATSGASVQQLYELCFCMWTLTYECNSSATVRANFSRDGAVAALVDLVAAAPREKVIRVALSALRNLATCTTTVNSSQFLTEMIGCGLIQLIDRLKERNWTDSDMLEDLDLLYKLLHETFREMSRWDVYKAEVESGHLEWGVIHTDSFFREHAKKFEGENSDFAVLRMLVLLVAGNDEDVATIACYDIGEFVRHYPSGRVIAKRLGAKDIVMHLIDSDNKELRRHALQCVSKMMVHNWTVSLVHRVGLSAPPTKPA